MSAEPERPSARAVERLTTGVGEDVTDLRTQLRSALDEAERLQAAGRGDLAVSVLEEQRDALLEVHQRLEARLAEAAVEREAERVVGAAAPALDTPEGAPTPVGVPSDDGMAVRDDSMALRLVASAVAAVLGVALLLSPELGSGGLTAAGSTAATDALQDATAPGAGDAARVASTTTPSASSDRGGGVVAGTTDLSALALPEADLLPVTTPGQDDTEDADPADPALVPLPDVSRTVDELTPGSPSLPEAEADEGDEQEATQSDGDGDGDGGADADDGTNAGDDTTEQDAPTDDASDDTEPDDEAAQSPEDDAAGGDEADGSWPTDDGSADDGSTGGGKTGDGGGSLDTDGGGSSGGDGGDLDLDGTDGEPTSLER